MLKLVAESTFTSTYALHLNHRQLINEAYNVAVSDDAASERYELKSELFHFQPKHHSGQVEQKKRKRKADANDKVNPAKEIEILKKYLQKLPKENNVSIFELERYWDEAYTLPQLHGSNSSGIFQKFQLEGATTYLIPPGASFFNHNVEELPKLLPQLLPNYDIIVMDPPWRNKYIRRVKRAKQSLGYAMLDNDQLRLMPVDKLIHKHTLVAIWCTNAEQHQIALETQLLPRWRLTLLHRLKWYKLNTANVLIGEIREGNQKQPFEMLYLACHKDSFDQHSASLKDVQLLLSVPSIIHSHKPPLFPWLRQHVQHVVGESTPTCLELFARYLQPQCTSIGLEVLKLMDTRLYNKIEYN
ncbi:methyltransferase-like protein 4 [Scaptodrosophila lebanonensis]|uniref:Methyltransferase-like protein 4 n=1 Tax=Drosophila lebanonensis TaxID=7225 RepID=A0A6J2TEJ6_DROLE|nr:methyltransferase-like protein 4 [Scaptodrosophila lebanonensis]